MKKIIAYILSGIIGGVSVVFVQSYFNKENAITKNTSAQSVHATPVDFAKSNLFALNNDFSTAVEKSINAVVHIRTITEKTNLIYDPFHSWFFGSRPQVQPYIQEGSGSGVIISDNGYIVTNNHVVKNSDKIEVTLNDKRIYKAELIGSDPSTDLAVLKIDEKNLPFILFGNSDDIKVGEWVLAVGNPFNLYSTVTAGIISAKGRNIHVIENNPESGNFPIESFIQTDAAVNPGNSGGALVNINGELIGINTAIASNNGAYQGYAFAIPVNVVKKIVSDIIEYGTVQRAYLGVSIRDIDAEFAKSNNIKTLNGVYVHDVLPNGAAEESGIKAGDIITKINDKEIKKLSEFQEQLSKYRPGDKVKITILRKDKELNIDVILKNKNNQIGLIKRENMPSVNLTKLGASFEEISKEEATSLGIEGGVKIVNIEPGKLMSVGVKKNFIITAIDKKKVLNMKDLRELLENKTGNVILIEGVYPNGIRAYYGFNL
ncbi:MAG: Do family serine endopeptidase [Bacteroidia bacterium]|nr:Do family serine endopeptidase [Bacteroidia bacterium]